MTGSAHVRIGPGDQISFTIERPAAYDAVALSDDGIRQTIRWDPAWLYYGTLFPACPQGRRVLDQLMNALPHAARFYDVNLRPGFDSSELEKSSKRMVGR